MQMFVFENLESGKIVSIDAVNVSKARLDLGDEWHLAPLVPRSAMQSLFDATVAAERAANLGDATKLKAAKQLKVRRETLAQILARIM
jgi:hypothetical protein